MDQLDPGLYTVAWLALLEIEARAALHLLDNRHRGRFPMGRGDDYVFQAGDICGHNVIIATLPTGQEYGPGSAGALASQVKRFFPNLWFGLLVGVAAGLPDLSRNRDIRLGECSRKETGQDGFQLLRSSRVLANTETVVRSALGSIRLEALNDAERFLRYYGDIKDEEHPTGTFVDPGQERDSLYELDDGGIARLVERERRQDSKRTRVWYGPIGSGEKLMKNARKRDELRDKYGIIGLEMEAAGTVNRIPVGVIRGVCDYGDEQKNKEWQPYAAAMAAAYAKAVLAKIPPKSPRCDDHDNQILRPSPDEAQAAPKPLDGEQKQALLESLRFDQIDSRHETIRKAHAKTCKWLLRKSEYLDWLDSNKLDDHHGFLWIKGKPGAGKSTLMKFALNNARTRMKDRIIIAFFFNARGDILEKSTTGMYQSLLLQLLERLPNLQSVFDSLGLLSRNGGPQHWSIESLKELFEQAVMGLGSSSLVCLIDALDECNEDQIRDMVSFFEHVGNQTTSAGIAFQVCFSSRHYPYITISRGLHLVLEGQEGHDQDIVSYLDSELKIGHGKLAETIRAELKEKASGVFMWVVLVVRMLQQEHNHGNTHKLLQKLRDIPGDLHELFRDILRRDNHDKDQLLLCIQWVLFAKQPLNLEELYFAILIGVDPEAVSDYDPDEIEEAGMKRFILSSSKGLAEVTRSKKTRTVQFIHESVRDFLLKENGLKEISPDLGANFQGESHERLKQCCLDYMSIGIPGLNIDASLPKASSQAAIDARKSAKRAYPFLDYAVRNILYHADAAEGGGVSQSSFLQAFQLADWIKLDNLFEKHEARRHTQKASLLYLLSEHNLANLIAIHPSNLSCFEVEVERYGPPLLAALSTGSREAVYALLKAQAKTQPLISPLHTLCEQYFRDGNRQSDIGRDFNFSQHRGILSHLAEAGEEIIIAFVFALGEHSADIKPRDKNQGTPLIYATKKGYETIVRMFLDEGVAIETVGRNGRTPLSYAAGNGYEAIVKLLLDHGAVIEAADIHGQTPLSYALTPLSYAAGSNSETKAVVRLLLDHSAAIEGIDKSGQTPGTSEPLSSDIILPTRLWEYIQYEDSEKVQTPAQPDWDISGNALPVPEAASVAPVSIGPRERFDSLKDYSTALAFTEIDQPHSVEAIGQEIRSALFYAKNYKATFELEWDIFEFFEMQVYSRPPHEVFEGVVTLTGSSVDAQAATCAQYLGQTWPSTAGDMVALMERVLEFNRRQSDPISCELSDKTTLYVCVRNSKFLAEAYGNAGTIAEIGQQLAWLGAALRTSPEHSGLVYCTPTISILPNSSPSSQSEFQLHSTGIAFKIGFTTEKIPVPQSTTGQCWHAIFRNPVIVRGYPIPQRAERNIGLEIPLNIMARLAQAAEIHQFRDKVCMKGFSTMLVPIRRTRDILCWHLIYDKDGRRISYLDNDLDQERDIARLDILEHSRHVLGWCSKAKLFVGSSVKHSMLPKPNVGGALAGRSVRRGKTVPGRSTVSVGARESSQLFSDGYVDRLLFLKRHFVLLWDKDDERGWLVSGIIALLLAWRVFLTGPYKSAIEFQSEDFEMSDQILTPMSAFDTLNNDHNQKLPLYSDGTSLKSKIEDLGRLLEILIDHQTDVTEKCDIKLSTKPRGDLEGWEFEDVAVENQDLLHPRVAEIKPHGKGWVDFTRAIQAVTLFGCGFGDIIQPAVTTCSKWASLPTGRFYVAVCVSDLDQVFKEHGFPPDGHIRLSDSLIWHTPAESEFCQCLPGSDQDDCEPVQTAFPLALSLSEPFNPRGNNLPEEGALIFGHSSQFAWIWDDLGYPRKGQLPDLALNSPRDSGTGASLASSETEGQVSRLSKSDTRLMQPPSYKKDSPTASPISEAARRTYPKHVYTVGILCALPKELAAVWALFDEIYNKPQDVPHDRYLFAKMGHCMVVATCLSNYGTIPAASAATAMRDDFGLQFCLLVGIGGGVPCKGKDIRLGDVVVGIQVVQYDLGYRRAGSFHMKEVPLGIPPNFLMDAIKTHLDANPNTARDQLSRLVEEITKFEKLKSYCHQGEDKDVLFEPCSECQSLGESCSRKSQHVPLLRRQRSTLEPEVHYGKIASGNQVIKDAVFRDEQASKLNVICFEMEAAGVANVLPCLVIRGICDYCDVHKNDVWHGYAAATAAAYAKLLLNVMNKTNTDGDSPRHSKRVRKTFAGTKRSWSQCINDDGIGLATAKAFVAASAKRVIIIGRRAKKINSAVAELEKEAASIGSPTVSEGRVCDVSNLESSASLWNLLRDDGIVVDVLVLNAAAVGAIKPLIEIGRDNILKDYDLNFRTNLDFTERLYKQEGKGAGGRKVVVGISTLAIYLWNVVKDRPSYGPSKSAGTLILQQFARAFKPEELQVSIVHPGAVWTDGMGQAGASESTYQCDDVNLSAHFIVWAASPQAEFLHGRLVWANWDVNELKGEAFRKQLDENPSLLTVGVEGLSEATDLAVV
ncbi:hypothetical protein NM208_g2710 [Fusarium decemcellulare]|uniref:Uncharacterized protein n=1 Tax=Fusarium decemcellulare TaxID=57161 RepID=A0ACC1SRQ0_9HYPO|nr:hypothetical protein NM208_g2710 [Fusarium decemcellulare]